VIDKQTEHQFSFSATKKSSISVAAEYGMYDFEFAGEQVTIEPALAELEGKTADCVARILEDKRLNVKDPQERWTLACFLAVQMVRTSAVREQQADLMSRMREYLEKEGAPAEFFAPDPLVGEGENAAKAFMARSICNAPEDLGSLLYEKDWFLISTTPTDPFLLGDHPVAMFNEIDRPGRGNLGIKNQGIQIFMPLSPTLALAVWCPTLQKLLLKYVSDMSELSLRTEISVASKATWLQAIETVEAMQFGQPVQYLGENVLHFNSLQVISAERFVFSRKKDFSLVLDMVEKDSSLRRGPRMTEATGKF
jgi:hypothetical protein